MEPYSSATIQNIAFTESNVSRVVYIFLCMSKIQLKNVVFAHSNFQMLLEMQSSSTAIIQKNTLTKNNVPKVVCILLRMSTIQAE